MSTATEGDQKHTSPDFAVFDTLSKYIPYIAYSKKVPCLLFYFLFFGMSFPMKDHREFQNRCPGAK